MINKKRVQATAVPVPEKPVKAAKVLVIPPADKPIKPKKPKQLSIVPEDNEVKKTGPKPKDRRLVKSRPFLVLSDEAEYEAFHQAWEKSGLPSRSVFIHSLIQAQRAKK